MSDKQSLSKSPASTPSPIAAAPPGINLSELRPAELVELGSKGGIFQCPLCQKTFGYKNGLMRHIRLTHVGEKPYQCNICQRRFGYKHILMEHQNLHFGNRPYACNLCDKRFAARSNLIQHRLVHKKPYNCSLCSKRFDREDQLKKHLFAHPQSLLTCNVCQYAAASQSDLNRHMVEKHHPQVLETRPPVRRGSNESPPESQGEQSVEPITPPSESPIPTTQTQPPPPGHPPGPAHSPHTSRPSQRIDDIASHLSAAAARAGPVPPHGIVIKQEIDDSQTEGASCQEARHSVSSTEGGENQCSTSEASHQTIQTHEARMEELHRRAVETPRQAWVPGQAFPPPASIASLSSVSPFCTVDGGHDMAPGSALPAIHELFSRRSQRVMPTFTTFPPSMLGDARIGLPPPPPQEVPAAMMSPPGPVTSLPSSMPAPAASIPPPPTTRPMAQLPPITQVLRHTKEASVQHVAPLPGIPDLEDVISYYQSQGKLFRCQFCNIVFFERGMFFLHASLHGPSNPWECSICHKVCQDKNEFTLHFVNQQHV